MFGSKKQLYEASGGSTSGAFTSPTSKGNIMVALPNSFPTDYDKSNLQKQYKNVIGEDMRAYALIHEGDHGLRFAEGATLSDYRANREEWEHTARMRGSIVTSALGTQSSCQADGDC